MDTGQAIKQLRKKRGLNQAELAERCGMSVNAICSLETGKSYPPMETVKTICKALDIPQSYFLLFSIDMNDVPERKRKLFKSILEPIKDYLMDE